MSEGALLCVAPAVAAAVRDATGARDPRPAASPERVWRALQERASRREARRIPLDFAFDLPPDELLALVGGKAANLAVMSARPRAAGAARRSSSRPRPAARTSPAAGRTGSTTSSARRWPASRRAIGRRFGDAGGPAARQRPVRRAGLDARDDGHDPRPRAQRGHDGGPGARRPATRRSPPPAASGSARCSATSSASTPCPRTRGRSSGSRSRPCSAPGTASGPSPTARREGIPDDLGTAVTVQAMVFGNLGADSGTGVAVHAQPGDRRARAVRRRAVRRAGRGRGRRHARTEPIERARRAAARRRRRAAPRPPTRLERHLRDLCDIEFTIERGRLWLLQVRVGKRSPQAALRIAVDMAEDPAFPLTRARGGASASPPLLADPPTRTHRAERLRPAARDRARRVARHRDRRDRDRRRGGGRRPPRRAGDVILVRAETSPDDVARHGPRGRDPDAHGAGSRATRRSSPAAGGSRRSSARTGSRSATAWSRSAGDRSATAT